MTQYVPVIGIEIHVELATISKMFCGCPTDHFQKDPNTQTCPVCLGLPGALPVPNQKAIDWTIMIGMALGCHIRQVSKFDRKHYFYPDLPKGYQISQYDEPLCEDGILSTSEGVVGIERVHLEEDTGKLQHTTLDGKKVSLVDFNRSGVPLVEIVTKPDIVSSHHAAEYAKSIASIVRFLGVSDADMEKGSMRLEANISLKEKDAIKLPAYKVEIKNINSFRYLAQAIDYEIKRHTTLLSQGETPAQETRGWNERKSATVSQRSKETAKDYRYFPEPDIPPLQFDDNYIASLKKALPKLASDYAAEFEAKYNMRQDYISTLTQSPDWAQWASAILKNADQNEIKDLTNYIINQSVTPETDPKKVYKQFQKANQTTNISDDQYNQWIQASLSDNPQIVKKYHAGKTNVIGALIGDVMKRSKGQADAKKLTVLFKKALDEK